MCFRLLRKRVVHRRLDETPEGTSWRTSRNEGSDFGREGSFDPGRSAPVRMNLLDTLHVIIRDDNFPHMCDSRNIFSSIITFSLKIFPFNLIKFHKEKTIY